MKQILCLLVVLASTLLLTLASPKPAAALFEGAKNQACNGVNLNDNGSGCAANSSATLHNTLVLAINIFSIVIGVVAVIMIMVGGLKFITSAGDANGISGARNTILYAIIGLIIVALAQLIVHFVLTRIHP
jgi:hypothetical protein